MLTFNLPEAVVLHLNMYRRMQGPYLPIEITQEGIALSLDASRSHVSITMGTLIKRGLVKKESARVRGKNRRINIYELTGEGVLDAERLLSVLKEVHLYHDGVMTDGLVLYGKGVPIGEIIRESSTSGWSQSSKSLIAQVESKVVEAPVQSSTEKQEDPLIPPTSISELSQGQKEKEMESVPIVKRSQSGEIWYLPPQVEQPIGPYDTKVLDWYVLGFVGCALLLGPLYLIFISSTFSPVICLLWLFGAIFGILLISWALKNLKKMDPNASRRCTEMVVFCVIFTILLFYQVLFGTYRYSYSEMLSTLSIVSIVFAGIWLSLAILKNLDRHFRSRIALVTGLAFGLLGVFSPYYDVLSKYAGISLFLFLFASGMVLLSLEIQIFPVGTYVNILRVAIFIFVIVGLIYALVSIPLTLGMRTSIVLWIIILAVITTSYLLREQDTASKEKYHFLPDSRDTTKFLISTSLLAIGILIARSGTYIEGGLIVVLALVIAYYLVRPLRFDLKNIASFTLIIVAEAMTVLYFLIQW